MVNTIAVSAISVLLLLSDNGGRLHYYDSIGGMLDSVSDYSIEDGTLIILNNDQVRPEVKIVTNVLGDFDTSVMQEYNRKGIVMISMICFAYSDAEEIIITGVPNKITLTTPGDINTRVVEKLESLKETATVSRGTALKVIRSRLGASDFEALFDKVYDIKGIPSNEFMEVMYDSKFFQQLTGGK